MPINLNHLMFTNLIIFIFSCLKMSLQIICEKYRYNLEDLIGVGSQGKIYKCYSLSTGKQFAVKILKREYNYGQEENQIVILREIMRNCHRYVLKIEDILRDGFGNYVIMELYRESLFSFIEKGHPLPASQIKDIFYKILQGYQHICSLQLLHRDIKTQNIMITQNGDPVIIDFGLSIHRKKCFQSNQPKVGTFVYMPPETYHYSYYRPESDIWSLGMILFEMIMGKNDYLKNPKEFYHNLRIGQIRFILQLPIQTDYLLKKLVYETLKEKHSQRKSATSLLKIMDLELDLDLKSKRTENDMTRSRSINKSRNKSRNPGQICRNPIQINRKRNINPVERSQSKNPVQIEEIKFSLDVKLKLRSGSLYQMEVRQSPIKRIRYNQPKPEVDPAPQKKQKIRILSPHPTKNIKPSNSERRLQHGKGVYQDQSNYEKIGEGGICNYQFSPPRYMM